VRSAIPAAEAYYSDVGNYTNMKPASGDAPDSGGLEGIDSGIYRNLTVFGSPTGYCLSAAIGTHTAQGRRPRRHGRRQHGRDGLRQRWWLGNADG
jgi:hypothetical protein